MKRAVHSFCLIENKSLVLSWHRYTNSGDQLPGGYTGNTEPYGISPQVFAEMFPGSTLLTDCMDRLRADAEALVATHESQTWREYDISGVEIIKAYATIARNRYQLQYLEDNPPNIHIEWWRLRNGQRLPVWCNGVLLYEHLTDANGQMYATVNSNKGVIRNADMSRRLVGMMQACVPIVDALDEQYGIR